MEAKWCNGPRTTTHPTGRYSGSFIHSEELRGVGNVWKADLTMVAPIRARRRPPPTADLLYIPANNVERGKDLSRRLEQLTPGQLECLVLVAQHLSSKEIGKRLSISPHTVDQRIRGALKLLGVSRRAQAVRIVRRQIEASRFDFADQQRSQRGDLEIHKQRAKAQTPLWFMPLPFATRTEPTNHMSVGLRLLWIALIGIAAAFFAGLYLAAFESVERLLER